MEVLWECDRLPRVEQWFARMRARSTFRPAFVDWLPAELADEMRANGERSRAAVRALLGVS
jgi:glutathione S-transferase